MRIIEMLEQILLKDLQELDKELKDCGIRPLEKSDRKKIKKYQKPRGGEPMKQKDIVKNLTVMGYQVVWVTYNYWQVPKVNNTILAYMYTQGSTQGVRTDYHLQDIINAIEGEYSDMDEYFEANYIPF